MRICKRFILLMIIGMFMHPAIGLSDDVDVGQIIEKSANGQFIQVHDRIYNVIKVELLAVEDKPQAGSAEMLSEGDIVRVVKGQKKDGYWQADLVTLYVGELAQEKRKEMELPDAQATVNRQQPSEKAVGSDTIIFENGVWHN